MREETAAAKERYTALLSTRTPPPPDTIRCAMDGLQRISDDAQKKDEPAAKTPLCDAAKASLTSGNADQAKADLEKVRDKADVSADEKACAVAALQRFDGAETHLTRRVNQAIAKIWPDGIQFTGAPIGWVALALLLLALLIVWRVVRAWRSDRRPYPVEVKQVLGKSGSADGTLQTYLSQRLLMLGAPPPPTVPYGSVGEAIAEVIETVAPAARGALAKNVVKVARKIVPNRGFEVSAALHERTDEPKHGITVELRRRRTGELIASEHMWRKAPHEAVASAAAHVFQVIMDQPRIRNRVPRWGRWTMTDDRALLAYHEARRLSQEERNDAAAVPLYAKAAKLEPTNAFVRQGLARALENTDAYADALVTRLATVRLAPSLTDAWYQLAVLWATFSSEYDAGEDPLQGTPLSQGLAIQRAVEAVRGSGVPNVTTGSRASRSLTSLRLAEFSWRMCLKTLSYSTVLRLFANKRTRGLTKGMLLPLSRTRSGFRTSSKAMHYATQIKLSKATGAAAMLTAEQLTVEAAGWWRWRHRFRWHWHPSTRSEVYYNVACLLAQFKPEVRAEVVSSLNQSYGSDLADSGDDLPYALSGDPDLMSVRTSPEFLRWEVSLTTKHINGTDSGAFKKDLEKEATQQVETWRGRINLLQNAGRLPDAVTWAAEQRDAFASLTETSTAPAAQAIRVLADRLHRQWKNREIAAVQARAGQAPQITLATLREWAQSAAVTWDALRVWSRGPDAQATHRLRTLAGSIQPRSM